MKKANQNEKTKYPLKTRFIGLVLFLPSVILLVSGIIMYTKTLGTQLLFINSSTGMVFRNYWVFLLVAVICLIAAVIIRLRLYKHTKALLALKAAGDSPQLTEGDKAVKPDKAENSDNVKKVDFSKAEKANIQDKSKDNDQDAAKSDNKQSDAEPENAAKKTENEINFDKLMDEAENLTSDKTENKPDVKVCPECGAKLIDGAAFCSKCGKKIG